MNSYKLICVLLSSANLGSRVQRGWVVLPWPQRTGVPRGQPARTLGQNRVEKSKIQITFWKVDKVGNDNLGSRELGSAFPVVPNTQAINNYLWKLLLKSFYNVTKRRIVNFLNAILFTCFHGTVAQCSASEYNTQRPSDKQLKAPQLSTLYTFIINISDEVGETLPPRTSLKLQGGEHTSQTLPKDILSHCFIVATREVRLHLQCLDTIL